MRARLISVPFLLGREGEGMGAGPVAMEPWTTDVLGLTPGDVHRIDRSEPWTTEVAACFELNREVAGAVAGAVASRELPVVLTGNCHTQQGVVAGLSGEDLALVWMDCHADFHTPETTVSGFFDGFGLAMVAGRCWRALCDSVPGFRPLPEDRVLLVGARDFDGTERALVEDSAITAAQPGDEAVAPAWLAAQRDRGRSVSLHVDLDVLDPSEGRANAFAVGPGLRREELLAMVSAVAAAMPIAALTLSAYDPACDPEGRVAAVAAQVVERVVRA